VFNPVPRAVCQSVADILLDQLNKLGHLGVEKKRRGQVANVEAKIRHHDAEAVAGENRVVGSLVAGHVDDATGSA
jgi:hypothetical protein